MDEKKWQILFHEAEMQGDIRAGDLCRHQAVVEQK